MEANASLLQGSPTSRFLFQGVAPCLAAGRLRSACRPMARNNIRGDSWCQRENCAGGLGKRPSPWAEWRKAAGKNWKGRDIGYAL